MANNRKQTVIKLTNKDRSQSGLRSLKKHRGLMLSAQFRARYIAKTGKLLHEDGTPAGTWWKVIDKIAKTRFSTEGENIADGQDSSVEVDSAWMHSPEHRANILNKKYTLIGVGVAADRSGRLWWVQHFAG